MKDKKGFLILVIGMVIFMVGAYALYTQLSEKIAPPEQLATQPTPQTQQTQKAPDFTVYDKEGNAVKLSDFFGKPIVLNFWASWCIPCRQEAPVLRKIADDYGKRGVAIVSVSLDSSMDEWKEGVTSLGLGWTQLCAPNGGSAEAAAAYGISSIPMLILIDAEGKIVVRGEPAYRVAQLLEELMK